MKKTVVREKINKTITFGGALWQLHSGGVVNEKIFCNQFPSLIEMEKHCFYIMDCLFFNEATCKFPLFGLLGGGEFFLLLLFEFIHGFTVWLTETVQPKRNYLYV